MLTFDEIATASWKRKNKGPFSALKALWENPGTTRVEAARTLGVSKMAATNSVNKLIELGIVEEGQTADSKRGRRPVSLRFRGDLFYALGISFHEGDQARACLINAAGETLAEKRGYIADSDATRKLEIVGEWLRSILGATGTPLEKVAGVGASVTGIVNPENGRIVSSAQFPDVTDFDLAGHYARAFGKPTYVANMSRLLPSLERRLGKAGNMRSFLYLCPGFGLGMMLNGRLYAGHQGNAGEAGFTRIRDYGEIGPDGRDGLFGNVAPFYKVTDKLEEIIAAGGNTRVKNYLRPETSKVSLDMVVSAIKDGDQLCARLLSETFQVIGEVVLNLAYLFNPEAIFLEPWTADCPTCSLDIVKSHMAHYGVCHWGLKTEILSAARGKESLALGAAMLPIDAIFKG